MINVVAVLRLFELVLELRLALILKHVGDPVI